MASRNKDNGATGLRKKCDDIFIHSDTIHERDGQTDGQPPTNSKYRAYTLRCAVKIVNEF